MQTPLRILLAGDYPDDPRLGSAKVFAKLQCEFRAMGHQCDTITASDLGARPAGRQLRQLVAPALAARAIRRRMQQSPVDVIDAASAEGLWVALARRAGALRTACICRSNGLEHLNYARMLDDARVGLTTKAWWRRVWYPASRLSQVAGAARASDRLLLLTDTDRAFAIARGWKRAECIDVVPHGVDERYLGDCAVLHAPRGSGLLFCATWDHMKGIRYLVDAFALIHEHGRRPNLTVLGPGVSEMDVL
ncbi:MAG TPA: glycosyltransferase, partial [Vicinamibacterales bacterium]|nr:glycosyltransferase [Vicinamibacterales bacterium]